MILLFRSVPVNVLSSILTRVCSWMYKPRWVARWISEWITIPRPLLISIPRNWSWRIRARRMRLSNRWKPVTWAWIPAIPWLMEVRLYLVWKRIYNLVSCEWTPCLPSRNLNPRRLAQKGACRRSPSRSRWMNTTRTVTSSWAIISMITTISLWSLCLPSPPVSRSLR